MHPHDTTKRCSTCDTEKPITDFRKTRGYADGYTGQCKACILNQRRAHNADPDVRERRRIHDREYKQQPHVKKSARAYMQRPDVNERVKERERERWRNDAHLREYKRAYLRERYQNNPEHRQKQKAHSMAAIHRRRARKEANGGSYTAKEWRDLCAKYGHVCLCCGEAKPLTVDHVVPLVSGGSNDISNIQPLCLDCNLRKHTRTIDYRPDYTPPFP